MYQARSVSRPSHRPSVALAIRSLIVLIALVFSGCSIQLSPAYDQATFTSISDLNVKTETLFASVSKGGTAGDFPKYKATYDQVIGGFSAARVATASRDVPAPSQRVLGIAHLNGGCGDDPASCVNPTPHHLDKVIALLTAMRDTHQQGKLVSELVTGLNGQGGFKGQYEIEMSRILVFETALQR
ncbi:hypothetical protein [Mesorhizobium sp.]|uniref:hypothetical protein n=1 Tax=Mesorhizobium sp. TaxID=1871066 RepID=UPI000FE4B9A2|nr:hypothetical protein [Mesorhizobium sp.]RWD71059.1 MAG: hypothetical protein EOS37_12670 [Mesorhizobium sp.]TIV25923.1 MAG: hypothetical protein E5V90_25320 [Mesorhizobium sp.]